MGRKVFITSEISVDEKLIEVAERDPQAALLWPWFLTVFDDWGRAEANSKRLKVSVFPAISNVTYEDVERALTLYESVGLIELYEVGGKRYMAISPEKWYKYQTHMRKKRRPGKDKMTSNYPPPPSFQAEKAGENEFPVGPRGETRGNAGTPWDPVPSPSPTPSREAGSKLSDSVDVLEKKAKTLASPMEGEACAPEDGSALSREGFSLEGDSAKAEETKIIREIWEYYCKKIKPCKLTELRKTKIRQRLRDFKDPEKLKRAIDNLSADPWIMGDNERGKFYATLEYVFRSTEKTEEWIERAPGNNGKKAGKPRDRPASASLSAYEDLANRLFERGGSPNVSNVSGFALESGGGDERSGGLPDFERRPDRERGIPPP